MRLVLTFAALLAVPAHAWPVDWVHDVEPGKERFIKLPKVDWWEVEDPKVLQVEWLADSNELLLSGLKPGRTVVLLGAEGKVAAWRVRVGGKPVVDEKLKEAAQKACPDLKLTPLEDVKLAVTVHAEPCRQALRALFQTDVAEARSLELTWSGEVLQAQLKELQRAFDGVAKGRVSAKYVGAGLVLGGKVSEAEHRKLLWELFRRALGRFALDDQLEVTPAEVRDGGAVPEPKKP